MRELLLLGKVVGRDALGEDLGEEGPIAGDDFEEGGLSVYSHELWVSPCFNCRKLRGANRCFIQVNFYLLLIRYTCDLGGAKPAARPNGPEKLNATKLPWKKGLPQLRDHATSEVAQSIKEGVSLSNPGNYESVRMNGKRMKVQHVLPFPSLSGVPTMSPPGTIAILFVVETTCPKFRPRSGGVESQGIAHEDPSCALDVSLDPGNCRVIFFDDVDIQGHEFAVGIYAHDSVLLVLKGVPGNRRLTKEQCHSSTATGGLSAHFEVDLIDLPRGLCRIDGSVSELAIVLG